MEAAFPAASKIASAAAGWTVSVSDPSGVPESEIPKVYWFPSILILLGVALLRVAEPPEMEKAKSEASRAPDPPFVLKTASSNVTATVLLLAAKEIALYVGAVVSPELPPAMPATVKFVALVSVIVWFPAVPAFDAVRLIRPASALAVIAIG